MLFDCSFTVCTFLPGPLPPLTAALVIAIFLLVWWRWRHESHAIPSSSFTRRQVAFTFFIQNMDFISYVRPLLMIIINTDKHGDDFFQLFVWPNLQNIWFTTIKNSIKKEKQQIVILPMNIPLIYFIIFLYIYFLINQLINTKTTKQIHCLHRVIKVCWLTGDWPYLLWHYVWMFVCLPRLGYLISLWMETLYHQQWVTETVAKLSLMWVGLWESWMCPERWSCFLKAWVLVILMLQIILSLLCALALTELPTVNSWGWRSRKRGSSFCCQKVILGLF